MSGVVQLGRLLEAEPRPAPTLVPDHPARFEANETWDAHRFAVEQVRALVRQVFCPGWPRPARHVAFSGVSDSRGVPQICARVAAELAAQVRSRGSRVCAFEADTHSAGLLDFLTAEFGTTRQQDPEAVPLLHKRFGENLYFVSATALNPGERGCLSPARIACALSELRRHFEFAILHCVPVGVYDQTALIARSADGIVLVLRAGHTRRRAAWQAKQLLQRANARVIGTVLDQRIFPVPEAIYRRL
jgi:hypothetical protein